jgi:hypothetical protein
MKQDSPFKNESFRIILEFIILLLIVALIVTLVITSQIDDSGKKAREEAQLIYDNITEVMAEKSSKTIDKLLCLSFDETEHKLVAAAYSGEELIDFSMNVEASTLEEYLPSLLEENFLGDSSFDCLTLPINTGITLMDNPTLEDIAYKVTILGEDILIYGTSLSIEGVYTSFYQRTYDSVNNTWNEDGHSSSSDQDGNKTLFELYKLILVD